MDSTLILKGNIAFAEKIGELTVRPHSCLICEKGSISGVFDEPPEKYALCDITDFGDAYILPSFSDMHLHAPQYPMLGLGMDLPLIEWLNTYTYPMEERFIDPVYAREVYSRLAEELISNGTTRVCMFSSLHREATLILMEEMEKAGVTGYIGKVNMDRNGGVRLHETTEESKAATLEWLDECGGFCSVKPMLTPRFTPSCTDGLMAWLGELALERDLPVQSHLSESKNEIAWVRELHPECEEYWDTYYKYGMWKKGTVMAHCVHSSVREREAMKRAGVLAVHCADSNTNIASGIAPVRKYIDEGVDIALGTDIAGGASVSLLDAAAQAVRVSKLRFYAHPDEAFLTVKEALYLATTAGQKYFGAGPGFRAGDSLHAVVIDDSTLPPQRDLSHEERLGRMVYLARAGEIKAVFSEGRRVK